jgi:hypothetical protein
MWQTGWLPLLIYPNSTYYCNELRRIGLLFTLNAIQVPLVARKRPTVAPAEGLLTEAVLTMNALRRTAAHDPKQASADRAGSPIRQRAHLAEVLKGE